ncbi:MAG: twin transmembrane helix small protein [Pseudomonadota bacterium]
MLSKIIIIAFLLAIGWTLISSFYFLVKDKGEGDRTVRRLTWRISLSLVLFLLLYLFFRLGWIEPSSRGPIGLKPEVEQPADG